MLKFMKWELLNIFKSRTKQFIIAGIFLLLMLIIPYNESVIYGFGMMILTFGALGSLFSAYFVGIRYIIKTYSEKTFLLESMISFSPSKLLLSKYLIAGIMTIGSILLSVLMFGIAMFKMGDLNLIAVLGDSINELMHLFGNFESILFVLYLIVIAISFMSFVTMFYVMFKSKKPGKKGNSIVPLGVFAYIIGIGTLNTLLFDFVYKAFNLGIVGMLLIMISITALTIVLFFRVSVNFIENRLQVYS